jgi:hypothetical protein
MGRQAHNRWAARRTPAPVGSLAHSLRHQIRRQSRFRRNGDFAECRSRSVPPMHGQRPTRLSPLPPGLDPNRPWDERPTGAGLAASIAARPRLALRRAPNARQPARVAMARTPVPPARPGRVVSPEPVGASAPIPIACHRCPPAPEAVAAVLRARAAARVRRLRSHAVRGLGSGASHAARLRLRHAFREAGPGVPPAGQVRPPAPAA